jgi:hypothetical protein
MVYAANGKLKACREAATTQNKFNVGIDNQKFTHALTIGMVLALGSLELQSGFPSFVKCSQAEGTETN